MSKSKQTPVVRPEIELVEFFRRNGYMRVPNQALREDAPREYKKGYEIRLVARSQRELSTMRRLLRQVDLRPGKPFPKHNQWVQPVYGRDSMDRFKSWVEQYARIRDGKKATTGKVKKAAKPAAATKPAPRKAR
jgi:hypothetical protein